MRDDFTGTSWSVPVEDLQRKERENFLHALAGRVRARGAQNLQKITHARVPIIKFKDIVTNVEVDVSIDSIGAQFKSVAIGIVASMDWRVGALVRLIKLWARHHNLNDSSTGTFNSFALTLLVIFHCQTRSPAILPPIAELFGCDDGAIERVRNGEGEVYPEERPMHDHKRPDLLILRDMQTEVKMRAAAKTLQAKNNKNNNRNSASAGENQETLLELLSSFFALLQGLMEAWNGPDDALSRVLCRVRVDTWHGCLKYAPWTDKKDGAYHCSIEDPFDFTDNVGRTIRDSTIDRILHVLDEAVQNCTGAVHGIELGLEHLFGEDLLAEASMNDFQLVELGILDVDRLSCVPPTELWVPESLQGYVSTRQPFIEPESNIRRGGRRSSSGGGGGSSLLVRPDISSPGAVLEFPKLSLEGEKPFAAAGRTSVFSAGFSAPMDVDGEEDGNEDSSYAAGSIHWDELQILVNQTHAVIAAEDAEEAVREAEREAHRAARKEAKQRKERARKSLKDATKNASSSEKPAVIEVSKNTAGEGGTKAGSQGGQAGQDQPVKKPNRRERRRGKGRGGGGGKGDADNDTTAGDNNGGGNGGRRASNKSGKKKQPQAVLVVPRPPPPPGL